MTIPIGEQSVATGAGVGGLTAAAAQSAFFANVIVLERGDLPAEAPPPDVDRSMTFQAALTRLAVHKVMVDVRHLIKPRSVFREPAFAQRVPAEMDAA